MTAVYIMNDTITSSDVVNGSDVTTATAFTVTSSLSEGGCGEEGGVCNVTETPGSIPLCWRLAPPPVPPWLRDSPDRLFELTRHCKSWTLYQELCNGGTSNSTLGYPRHVETSEDGVEAVDLSGGGVQWVIPALALVVVLLLLLLALVLYKNYSRPHKKSMYRVSGAAYRFKPPRSGSSWGGGPLVESETSDSYLGQPATERGPEFRYTRSPVCRLLEQTQYVATPTEDQHRPRPSGPPAFTSPAYFLPALSWLRLPLLRQSWPGESNGAARDTTLYNAAQPITCECGETTHQWRTEGEGRWAECKDNDDDDPEYSEIWDGDVPYSSLNPTQSSLNGIGPYEYEMQERTNRRVSHDLDPSSRDGHRPRKGQANGHDHRYEKLWPCREAEDNGSTPRERSSFSSTPGTCENGWLSRYRLPSPCISNSEPTCRKLPNPDHAHCGEGGATAEDLTSDTELLPCESVTVVTSDCGCDVTDRDRADMVRSEVKYSNPVFEERGRQAPSPPVSSSPLLSRLLGYISWNKR